MRYAYLPLAVALCTALAAGASVTYADATDNTPDNVTNRPVFGRGDRYCEILLVRLKGMAFKAEVWGTQGLNDCPAPSWQTLDTKAVKSKTGALAVRPNGPRIFLPNSVTGSLPSARQRRFGELEMRMLATLKVNPRQGRAPYSERTVQRKTTFTFDRGEEIYELISPKGKVYVMQSMSQIVDPDLKLADLSALGSRLELPDGWTYQARTLNADLVLTVDGEAIVLQDDLKNTYQRMTLRKSQSD